MALPPHYVQTGNTPAIAGPGFGVFGCECGQSLLISGYEPRHFLGIAIRCASCGRVSETPGLAEGTPPPPSVTLVERGAENPPSAISLGTVLIGREEMDRLAALYGTMDIFCYPSLAEKGETFGVSVAEAMAARCAVVVSALSCFSDLVDDGKTGLVFAHREKNPYILLAECIARLLTDPHLRLEMAARGQERSRQFDYHEVSGRILKDLAFLTGADGEKQQR